MWSRCRTLARTSTRSATAFSSACATRKTLPALEFAVADFKPGSTTSARDNNLSFGGTQIFATTTNVEQFLLIYGGTLPDGLGQTAVENQLVFSPGGLSNGNNTAAFVASGVSGAKSQLSLRQFPDHARDLSALALTSVVRLNGADFDQRGAAAQRSSWARAAADSVRGYDPRTANGTQGVLASFELRSPSYHPLAGMAGRPDPGHGPVPAVLRFRLCLGSARADRPGPVRLPAQRGLGARYSIDRYLDLRFDYGWQLSKPPGATRTGNLADISVTLAY